MTVSVTRLTAVVRGSGFFAAGERSEKADYQKSAAESFEGFHLEINLRGLSDRVQRNGAAMGTAAPFVHLIFLMAV